MLRAFRDRWATVSLATLFYWVATHMLTAYVPIRMSALGASNPEIGVAVAARGVLPFLFAMWVGKLSDRLGGWRLLWPSAALMVVIGPLHAAATTPLHFAVLQAVMGIACVGVWIALQAVVTHAGTGETLRAHLSLFSFMWGAGVAVGPIIGALLYDRLSFTALAWAFTGASLAILVSAWAIPWAQAREAERAASAPVAFRQAVTQIAGRPAIRSVLLSSFVIQYTFSIRNSFYPVALEDNGFSVSQIGLLLSIIGFTSLIVRMVLPWVLRHFRSTRVLVWSTVAGVVAICLTPVLLQYWLLVLAAGVFGCAVGLNPPITVELVARFTTAAERGLSAGMRVMVNRFAQVVQPVTFGAVAGAAGSTAAWPASAVVLTGLTTWMALSTRVIDDASDPPATTEVEPGGG